MPVRDHSKQNPGGEWFSGNYSGHIRQEFRLNEFPTFVGLSAGRTQRGKKQKRAELGRESYSQSLPAAHGVIYHRALAAATRHGWLAVCSTLPHAKVSRDRSPCRVDLDVRRAKAERAIETGGDDQVCREGCRDAGAAACQRTQLDETLARQDKRSESAGRA